MENFTEDYIGEEHWRFGMKETMLAQKLMNNHQSTITGTPI